MSGVEETLDFVTVVGGGTWAVPGGLVTGGAVYESAMVVECDEMGAENEM
jgi:hypothetical protein